LIVDDAPLLYHTGPRRLFPVVQQAVAHILGDVSKLRYVGFSHFEADECGALNDWLRAAPNVVPACGAVAAMVSVNDVADRPAQVLHEGVELTLGQRRVSWLDTPNLPHNWECGHLFEATTRTLFCGDVLTHSGGAELAPVTEDDDLVAKAEATRRAMPPGSVAIDCDTRKHLEKLAATEATLLALMHGSSYRGEARDCYVRSQARSACERCVNLREHVIARVQRRELACDRARGRTTKPSRRSSTDVRQLQLAFTNCDRDFQLAAESFYVATQGRDSQIRAALEARQLGLCHVGAIGDLLLCQGQIVTQLAQSQRVELGRDPLLYARIRRWRKSFRTQRLPRLGLARAHGALLRSQASPTCSSVPCMNSRHTPSAWRTDGP
jgi:glyoxylase-like metal-dependent hydrolase (beta-lactamase superfamily II)